jgi:hypothetical protein
MAQYTASTYHAVNAPLQDQTDTIFNSSVNQPVLQNQYKTAKLLHADFTTEEQEQLIAIQPTASLATNNTNHTGDCTLFRTNDSITLQTKGQGIKLYYLPSTGRIYNLQGLPSLAQSPPANQIKEFLPARKTLPRYGLADTQSALLKT